MDKQNICPYDWMVFGQEWSTDTCYNMDNLENIMLRRHTLYDSIYIKCLLMANQRPKLD